MNWKSELSIFSVRVDMTMALPRTVRSGPGKQDGIDIQKEYGEKRVRLSTRMDTTIVVFG
jgi:hypothetical protein